jgi:hypothetical protein
MPKRLKRPCDPIQLSKLVVDIATGQVQEAGVNESNVPDSRARREAQQRRITSLAQLANASEDPVVALVIERFRLWDECEARFTPNSDAFDAIVDETAEACGALEEQIVDTIATTRAGLIAQVELLAVEETAGRLDEEMTGRLRALITAGIMSVCREAGRPPAEQRPPPMSEGEYTALVHKLDASYYAKALPTPRSRA